MSTDIFFYLFSALTAGSALALVLCKNTVASALSLLVSLVGVAALFILLDAFLLAALMVFVYAGAVVALFLFIVMLIDTYGGVRKPFKKATIVASGLALALLVTGLAIRAKPQGRTLDTNRSKFEIGSLDDIHVVIIHLQVDNIVSITFQSSHGNTATAASGHHRIVMH